MSGTVKIPLTKGRYALIDQEDAERVSQYRWRVIQNKYVAGRKIQPRKRGVHCEEIRMHRLIVNAPKNMDVDHKDQDGFNNRKSNIRICTTAQNVAYRRKLNPKKFSSEYKGVFWNTYHKAWQASIKCLGKKFYLGRYKTPTEAALSYNKKAKELFGEFALINLLPNS